MYEFNNLPPEILKLAGDVAIQELEISKQRRALNAATELMTKERERLTSMLDELEMKKLALHDACENHTKGKL